MSQDFGLKISLPGYDVKTASPEQCSVHSSYDSMKVRLDSSNPQEGNILVTFNDTPAAGTYLITVIRHNYGYIPAYYFFFDVRGSSNNTGIEIGNAFPLDALSEAYFQAVPDTQNIAFNLVITPASTDVLTGEYFAFRYYIFANNGI